METADPVFVFFAGSKQLQAELVLETASHCPLWGANSPGQNIPSRTGGGDLGMLTWS